MFLQIHGKKIEVDDSFKSLSQAEQHAAIEHIAANMNQTPHGDPIGGAALGAAVGATPYLTGKATGILKDVAKSVINDIKGTPATPVPPPSSLDAKLNTNLDKGTWEPPKFTPKGMPVDPNVPSDVYNWMAGQHSTVPVRGTNTEEADRLAKEWKAKQDAKAAFEKANPGRTLTDAGLDVSKEEAAAMLQKEEAKKAAELLEYRIKQKAAEKTAENVATETARMGARANIGKKLPVAGALGMANITDLENRLSNEQYPQAVISGIGTAGSVLPFVKSLPFLGEIPNVAKVAGTGAAVAAPFINMAIDGKAPSKEDVAMGALGLVGGPFIQGMMPGTVQAATLDNPKNQGVYEEGQTDILSGTKLPKYAEGGDVKKPSAGIAGVYNQVGPVQGPSLSSIWAEHLASLPEKTAQNIMNTNTMVQNSMPYSFDPKKPLFDPNPNYDPQAAKDFNDYATNFMGSIKSPGGNWVGNRLEATLSQIKDKVPDINVAKTQTQDAGNFISRNFPEVDRAYGQYFEDTGHHSAYYAKDYWPWMQQNFPKEYEAISTGKTPAHAVNNWIDSKLGKYIKNDLATPNDPVRQLADKGISHINNIEDLYGGTSSRLKDFREAQGFPAKGHAETNMGHAWEEMADTHVYPTKITDYAFDNPATAKLNPWIGDLAAKNPNAQINELDRMAPPKLGFDHLADELRNSINPNSDLPQHLRLKPEALDRVTVPQAVQHVAKINEWRAAQIEKAAKESLNDFPIVHEGGDGYNIHELKMPDAPLELPNGLKVIDAGDGLFGVGVQDGTEIMHSPYAKTPENLIYKYNSNLARNKLDKALKNEGEQMGHCVGGYCEDVARGDSRIFSLRDPKGGAHVTIEGIPKLHNWDEIPQSVKDEADKVIPPHLYPASQEALDMRDAYIMKWMQANPKMQIEQIKGKSNGPVSEKYRGYIKDFLNKQDNLGHVKDLENVGLIDLRNTKGANYFHPAQTAHKAGNYPRFVTQADLDNFQ